MPDSFFIRFTPPFLLLFTIVFACLPPLAVGWLENDIGLEGNLTGPAFFAGAALPSAAAGVVCFFVSILQDKIYADYFVI